MGPGPARLTHGVQLVQLVVDEGRVTGAGAGVRLQGAVPPQAPGPARQPAAHPETLQQVADEVPEQAAGQVQAGGGQGPAQRPQGQPQLLGSLGEVPLGMRGPGEKGSVLEGPWRAAGWTGVGGRGDAWWALCLPCPATPTARGPAPHPGQVQVGLLAMPPEAHSWIRVGPRDRLSIDKEKRQEEQHQQPIRQPDQRGQQPQDPARAI